MKRIAVVVVLLIAAVLAAALAILVRPPSALVGPMARDKLIAMVKAATGRDLVVNGETSVAFLPRAHLKLGDVALSGPPGAASALLKAKSIEVTTDFWPLVKGGRDFSTVRVEAPEVALAVDKSGKGSWLFDVPGSSQPFSVASLDIAGGSVSYTDARDGTNAKIAGVDGAVSNVTRAALGNFSFKTAAGSYAGGSTPDAPALSFDSAGLSGDNVSGSGIKHFAMTSPQLSLRSGSSAATLDKLSATGDGLKSETIDALSLKAESVRYGSAGGSVVAARTVEASAQGLAAGRVGELHAAADRLGIAEGESRPSFELAKVEMKSPGGSFDQPMAADIGFDWSKERVTGHVELANPSTANGPAPIPLKLQLAARDSTLALDGKLTAAPSVDGTAVFTSKSLRNLAAWIGTELPKGPAFGVARLQGKVAGEGRRVAFSDAQLTLDDTTAKGALTVDLSGPRPKLSGSLAADKFDADSYVLGKPPKKTRDVGATSLAADADADPLANAAAAPATPPPVSLKEALKVYLLKLLQGMDAPAARALPGSAEPTVQELMSGSEEQPAAPGAAADTRAVKKPAPEPWSDAPLDLSALRRVDLDMALSVGKLTLAGLDLAAPDVKATLDDGALALDTKDLGLKGGKVTGRTTIDTRSGKPKLATNLKADNIDAVDIFSALGVTTYVAGKSAIEANLQGTAASQKDLVESVSGDVKVSMKKGSIVGYDFSDILGAFFEWLDGKLGYDPHRRSPFDKLEAGMKLTNGVAKSNGMRVDGPVISLTSDGTTKLPAREIDYHARVNLAAWFKPIAIRVFGDWQKPSKAVDVFDYTQNPSAVASPLDAFRSIDLKDAELAAMAGAILDKAESTGHPLSPHVKELLTGLKARAEGSQ